MEKSKFWLAQFLMISMIGLILGSSAFAKAPGHSKGSEMKNAHASDQAKSKANSNAGFDVVYADPVEEPPAEEPPVDEPVEDEPTVPQCSLESSYLCPDASACSAVGGEWLEGVGCI